MGCFNFCLYYLIRAWREKKRLQRRSKKSKRVLVNSDIESNQNDDRDVVDGPTNDVEDIGAYKKPLICRLILIWSILEVFILLIVLIFKKEEYPQNFLYDFCDGSIDCSAVLTRIMVFKMLSAMFVMVGVKTVSYCNIFVSKCFFIFILKLANNYTHIAMVGSKCFGYLSIFLCDNFIVSVM